MSSVTSLICNKFGGIRVRNSRFTEDQISCSDCQNVEFFSTGINSGVGIRTSKGNSALVSMPTGYIAIKGFESVQDGVSYCFVYAENQTEGKIFKYDIASNTLTAVKDGLSLTGKCAAETVAQGWKDWFIFSNGEEVLNIEIGRVNDNDEPDDVHEMSLTDVESRAVKGLGIFVFDGRLWIFNGSCLWYSKQEDVTDFSTVDVDLITSPGYIEYSKKITAACPYLGSIAVFHKDCSSLLSIEDDGSYSRTDDSPGGCAGYNSLVFHGTELYFYDNTKKGVFSFKQVVNGDKTLGENIAIDVQTLLTSIDDTDGDKIEVLSIVSDDKNEIWFKLPNNDGDYSTILIFDYIRLEWLKRKSNKLNSFGIISNKILSFYGSIFEEYIGSKFNNEFIPAYYNCTPVNLGMDNSLKILCFPARVTLDMTRTTEFYCKYIKNYNHLKKTNLKKIKTKSIKNALYWDVGTWNENYWASNESNAIYKLSSATFKVLEIQLLTQSDGDMFAVMSIELSKIKVKQV